MRFILDTNIIIPLEQSQQALAPSLANFVRLAHENRHQLIYHPATEDDIQRDNDPVRQKQTLDRLRQYTRLEARQNVLGTKEKITPTKSPITKFYIQSFVMQHMHS